MTEEIGWVFGYPGIVLKRDPNFVSVDDPGFEDYYPKNISLYQNYPNPFNPSTLIKYQLPVSDNVTIKVYDVLGNEITTLVDEFKPAGSYRISFDASKLSSGVYFYRLQTSGFNEIKKMVYLK